ncbi:MAG: N-6 DNA methylase [Caldisericum sp.]
MRLLRFLDNPEKDRENQEKFLYFDFDVLMTNPPFAGTVKERDILRLYKLAERNGRWVNKIGRHILFLERSLQFIRPGGRMAIVLPQGLLNNTNAEYIRRFVIDEAKILAVVSLHGNTFKPHTGTKTSVLFLQKYTDEEKEKIQQTRAKYEGEWEEFLSALKEKYKNLAWDSSINEEEIPEELNSFIEAYFESREEETEKSPIEETKGEETEEKTEENIGKKPLTTLVQEKSELDEALREKKEELKKANATRKTVLKKEIKTLQSKINKLIKEISQRTQAGQISLVLNEEQVTGTFKKYWLDGKVMKEIDYPIFFAINEKPVKDERGEYRYKKNPDGSFVLDEHGHPVIDHDLDEIADAFIKFAKEQGFDFWR